MSDKQKPMMVVFDEERVLRTVFPDLLPPSRSVREMLSEELPGHYVSKLSVHRSGFRFGLYEKSFKFGSITVTHFDAEPTNGRRRLLIAAVSVALVLCGSCTPAPPGLEVGVTNFSLNGALATFDRQMHEAGHGSSLGLSSAGKWTRNIRVDSGRGAY